MRNIESSPWLASPELVEIKSVPLEKQKINEFTLNLQVKRLTDSTASGAPGKAPGAPGKAPGAPGAPGAPAAPAAKGGKA
jgi:hypothetical protein